MGLTTNLNSVTLLPTPPRRPYRQVLRRGAYAVVCVLALALVGCSSTDDADNDDRQQVKASTAQVALPGSTMKIDHFGSEPRLDVRYLASTTSSTVSLTTSTRTKQVITGGTTGTSISTLEVPGTRVTFTARREQSKDNSNSNFAVTGASSADEQLAAHLQGSVGFRASFQLTAEGLATQVDLTADPQSSESSRRAIEPVIMHMAATLVPLPTEPVGIGAEWTATREAAGVLYPYKEVATYKLLSTHNNRVALSVVVNVTPFASELEVPGTEPLRQRFYLLRGTGEITVDRTQALAVGGTIRHIGSSEYSGGRRTVKQELLRVISWGETPTEN